MLTDVNWSNRIKIRTNTIPFQLQIETNHIQIGIKQIQNENNQLQNGKHNRIGNKHIHIDTKQFHIEKSHFPFHFIVKENCSKITKNSKEEKIYF